jgi:hypothetical protein
MSFFKNMGPLEELWGGDIFLSFLAWQDDEAYASSRSGDFWSHRHVSAAIQACAPLSDSSFVDLMWPVGCKFLRDYADSARDAGVTPLLVEDHVHRASWPEPEDKEPVGVVSPPERSGSSRALRLRPRGTLTRCLERLTRESSWWSDLAGDAQVSPARAWLESYFSDSGVKVCGGTKVVSGCVGGKTTSTALVRVLFGSEELNGGAKLLWVSPQLLSRLVTVRLFRPVSEGLLASLRSRARQWSEEQGIADMDLVQFMPGTLVLAVLPMPAEVVAVSALRGAAASWSVDVLGALSGGVAKRRSPWSGRWSAVLKRCLGGGTQRNPIGPSAEALTLPA